MTASERLNIHVMLNAKCLLNFLCNDGNIKKFDNSMNEKLRGVLPSTIYSLVIVTAGIYLHILCKANEEQHVLIFHSPTANIIAKYLNYTK